MGPYCLRCGKFTPGKVGMGWEKNEVQMADLEMQSDNECEVCKMLVKGLRSYRDRINAQMPLPSSFSVQCVPGRSFVVKRPVRTAPPSNSHVPINFVSS